MKHSKSLALKKRNKGWFYKRAMDETNYNSWEFLVSKMAYKPEMLKLCAQTATLYLCGKIDYTWCWGKKSHSNCGFITSWYDNSEFSNKMGRFAGEHITFKSNPRLLYIISAMD